MPDFSALFSAPGRRTLYGTPEGNDALTLVELMRQRGTGDLLHIARDDMRLDQLVQGVRYFAPDLEVLEFPAWDTVPYDRVSPNVGIVARRIDTLSRLALPPVKGQKPRLIIATVASAGQRVPKASVFRRSVFTIERGKDLNTDALMGYLARNGYSRSDQVMEAGEYAVRGGIIDLYPPGTEEPFRVDLFGDEVDGIRTFDPLTQRTTGTVKVVFLKPVSEVQLDDDSVSRFRTGYRELFGTPSREDGLYAAVSERRTVAGMENWLPLFHDDLDTLFAYLPSADITLDYQVDEAWQARLAQIAEYYTARVSLHEQGLEEGGLVYHPVAPDRLYVTPEEWPRLLATRAVVAFNPFVRPDLNEPDSLDAGGRRGRDFADIRAQPDLNVFDAVRQHIVAVAGKGRRAIVFAVSAGSRDRLTGMLRDHGVAGLMAVETWAEALALPKGQVAVVVIGFDHGIETPDMVLIGEQDILGDRLARPVKRKRKAEAFLKDVSALAEGDIVVHAEHGIGRYDGLETIRLGDAPHDCLRILYDGNDKLFVPVENIDVLSRYGSETAGVTLDRLGSPAWQARKAKLKERIRDMAAELIKVAALRQLRKAEEFVTPEGLYDEFCARFPYSETEDQLRAISDTLADLAAGRPMDRLVCGDVGFGKTEVALRAAFAAAMGGSQVAVVVPTTLLARQHYLGFVERFKGMPIRIGQLSRLVSTKDANLVKAELESGTLDIVIGTHALVAKSVKFKRLGLLIVDEEQHFGVAAKERLKQIKADVHVLTLSATPIPRTLQLALTGVRELSLIATPPIDRLAVHTFVLPFDAVVVREAILREKFRGGQCFYVCPRLADIERVAERLSKLVPEIKAVVAHGQLPATQLEEVMTAFADGKYDVLLATNIIESGLDMPKVNTIIIHRADLFGLGQLYQLRGRVGRGKTRGYAYLTLNPDRTLTAAAEKRLTVMQTLDSLGAGFSLASHDLDIRGAGNLLGDEQSGHIKEVGIELYQHLLEEAVAAAKAGGQDVEDERDWSPTIQLGSPVLIPEAYVKDLAVRLGLYRRIADIRDQAELESLAAEMIDRFGKLPLEVDNLLEVVRIKLLCRIANVERVEAGPKGCVISLRGNWFPNPQALVGYISRNIATVKVRPDHKIVTMRRWEDPAVRLTGARRLLEQLAGLAEGKAA